jgi:hypothetical protein
MVMPLRKTCLSDREFLLSVLESALARGDFHSLRTRLADSVSISIFAGALGRRQAARLGAVRRALDDAEEGRNRAGLPPFGPEDTAVPRHPGLPAEYWTAETVTAAIAVYETPAGRKRLKENLLNRRAFERLLAIRERLGQDVEV